MRAAELALFVHAMKLVIGFGSVEVFENAAARMPFRTAPPMFPALVSGGLGSWWEVGLPHPTNPSVCEIISVMYVENSNLRMFEGSFMSLSRFLSHRVRLPTLFGGRPRDSRVLAEFILYSCYVSICYKHKH